MSSSPSPEIPRDPPFEAVDAIRGYVHQFVVVVEKILDSGKEAVVYIETFEDLFTCIGGMMEATEVKDRSGTFSLTRRPACVMLDRWARLLLDEPGAAFVFVSTQEAGNLHNHSSAFKEWVTGSRTSQYVHDIAASLGEFLLSHPRNDFESLNNVLLNQELFEDFWQRIDWRLGSTDLGTRFDQLVTRIQKTEVFDEAQATERLYTWIGAIAMSASKHEVTERRWTLAMLKATESPAPQYMLTLTNLLLESDRHNSNRAEELLQKIFNELSQLKGHFLGREDTRTGLDELDSGSSACGGETLRGPVKEDTSRMPFPLLPRPDGDRVIGREDEYGKLHRAWEDESVAVVTVVGPPGQGKSALVSDWLDRMHAEDHWSEGSKLAWVFAGLGSEGEVDTVQDFFLEAWRIFGDTVPGGSTDLADARRLAKLLRHKNGVLGHARQLSTAIDIAVIVRL